MREHKRIVTSAPNLKCKHIVHLDDEFYSKSNDWQNAYTAVLQEADKSGFHSLAVPALGTGKTKAKVIRSVSRFWMIFFTFSKEFQ